MCIQIPEFYYLLEISCWSCHCFNFCMLKVLMLQYRKEVPKLAQNCIIISAKLIFFWGQAPWLPTEKDTAPPQTPHLHSSQYLSPNFNLIPTPLGWMTMTKLLVLICLYCLKCTKFGQLILRIIIKIDATRCQILRLKCTKIVFSWGSAPDTAGGAYSAPPDPLAGLKGAYF